MSGSPQALYGWPLHVQFTNNENRRSQLLLLSHVTQKTGHPTTIGLIFV